MNTLMKTRPVKQTGAAKRSEIVSVRLAPKLRYAADIAARTQRRTISSLIEVGVGVYLSNLKVETPGGDGRQSSLLALVDSLWDPDESDRFVLLAESGRWLLDIEEEHRWKAIREHFGAKNHLTLEQRQRLRPLYKKLKEQVRVALEEESDPIPSNRAQERHSGKKLF